MREMVAWMGTKLKILSTSENNCFEQLDSRFSRIPA